MGPSNVRTENRFGRTTYAVFQGALQWGRPMLGRKTRKGRNANGNDRSMLQWGRPMLGRKTEFTGGRFLGFAGSFNGAVQC